jgi:diadenosine tetraphosphate (Ap4A) HIT family hydrolase
VTLGSLIIAAKAEATAFSALPDAAFAELAMVIGDVESVLAEAIGQARMNYLMLMMVDPHVHFHALPRYDGSRRRNEIEIADAGWPGPPNLAGATPLSDDQTADQRGWLKSLWPARGR